MESYLLLKLHHMRGCQSALCMDSHSFPLPSFAFQLYLTLIYTSNTPMLAPLFSLAAQAPSAPSAEP